jgi:hypothetical protein
MKYLRHFFAIAVVLCAAEHQTQARAQALPTASGPGSYVSAGVGLSAYQEDYGQRIIGGGELYVDVHPTWRYGIEAEARYLRLHTDENVTQTSYLVGPHIYVCHCGRFRPYGKFLIGEGEIEFPFGLAHGSYLAYAPGGGLDVRISDYFSVRAVDVEYQSWPSFTYGNLHPYGVSAGINLRLNPMRKFPKK